MAQNPHSTPCHPQTMPSHNVLAAIAVECVKSNEIDHFRVRFVPHGDACIFKRNRILGQG